MISNLHIVIQVKSLRGGIYKASPQDAPEAKQRNVYGLSVTRKADKKEAAQLTDLSNKPPKLENYYIFV